MSNLLYDPSELASARAIAVMVPGALSRVSIFDPAQAWRAAGYGLVTYRFPGLDGRPVSPRLRIAEAAAEIVALAQQYPDKPICFLGYSTGGPIVITAAAQLDRDIKVAAMSSAVEGGGGVLTGVPGLVDVLGAGWRARSVKTDAVWLEYYRVLLFGRQVLQDPALTVKADEMIAAHKAEIVFPDGGKPRAHTDDLRQWRLPKGVNFPPGCIRFFVGLDDPVFSQSQTLEFAQRLGPASVTGYAGHGHLLFLSNLAVFDDIFAFFEGAPLKGSGITLA